jgi:hypothetical protein
MRAKHLVYLTAAVILAAACCAGVSASEGPQRKKKQRNLKVDSELLNRLPPTTNSGGESSGTVNIHIETVEDKDKPRRNKRKGGEKRQKSSKSGGSSDTKRRKRRNQVETGISTDPDSQSVNNIQLVDIQPSETSLERELDKNTWVFPLYRSMRALALAFEAYTVEWTRVAQAKIKPEESPELEQHRQALLSALDPSLNCQETEYSQLTGTPQMHIKIRCLKDVRTGALKEIYERLNSAFTARYPDRPNDLPDMYVRPETQRFSISRDWQGLPKRIKHPIAVNQVGECVKEAETDECEQLIKFSKHGYERVYLTLVLTDAKQ